MTVQRRKCRHLFRLFGTLFGFIICSLIYCEFIHYYVVISQCDWPQLKLTRLDTNSGELRVMVVADTHLLGSRNGHWFDKLRREWQMHRAFQSAITLHNPELVIFLGDLFDEGKWCSREEFKNYVARFHSLFHTPTTTEILIAAGNHDMGFHYSVNPYLSARFEEAFKAPSVNLRVVKGIMFVAINSMAMHGDDCFLCKPARLKIEAIARELRCVQEPGKKECKNVSKPKYQHYSLPVLVQHYPLYRDSDVLCSDSDSAPYPEKGLKFRERWECLSRESTDMLLGELEPRLVLSGHTHHGCQMHHNFSVGEERVKKRSVLEYTVASFSWRNKVNPTFAMLTISKDEYSIYKCHIPNENSVMFIYFTFGLCYFIFVLRKKIKIRNFLYFKFKRKV